MWSLYDLEIVSKVGREKIRTTKAWKQLNIQQQNRWDRRFSKVEVNPHHTWDFQMQFVSWIHNKEHLLPILRLCDNEGFNDSRASNTKSYKPRWYFGRKSENLIQRTKSSSYLFEKFMKNLDSYTWIGDRKLRDLNNRA